MPIGPLSCDYRMLQVRDSGYRRMALIYQRLKAEICYDRAREAWESCEFPWIYGLKSTRAGDLGERALALLCEEEGIACVKSPVPTYDLTIAAHRIEVKYSRFGEGEDYTFSGLRDTDWEIGVLIGQGPAITQLWAIPKEHLFDMIAAAPRATRPTAGKPGRISFRYFPPHAFRMYGGTVDEGMQSLRALVGLPPADVPAAPPTLVPAIGADGD